METSNKTKLVILAFLAVTLLTTMACGFGGISFSKGKATIDVTLTQDQVNKMIQQSNQNVEVSDDRLMEEIDRVEFHDGFIRVFGVDKKTNGTWDEGSIDFAVSAENDALKVKIIAVDLPGVTLDDPRIVNANQQIADAMTQSVNETNGEVLFKEVSVTETGLKLKLEVKLKTNQ